MGDGPSRGLRRGLPYSARVAGWQPFLTVIPGGEPHKLLPQRLRETFPETQLGVSWRDEDQQWDREFALLDAYESEFGELPPVNGQKSRASAQAAQGEGVKNES